MTEYELLFAVGGYAAAILFYIKHKTNKARSSLAAEVVRQYDMLLADVLSKGRDDFIPCKRRLVDKLTEDEIENTFPDVGRVLDGYVDLPRWRMVIASRYACANSHTKVQHSLMLGGVTALYQHLNLINKR